MSTSRRTALALAALLACAGLLASGASAGARTKPKPKPRPKLSANQRAARTDAARLLSAVALPAGATRLKGEPAGDDGYLKALTSLVGTRDGMVDTRWFQLAATTPAAVIAAIQAAPPAGMVATGTSSASNFSTGTSAQGVDFWLAPVAGILSDRVIEVTAAGLPDGSTAVMIQTESVWTLRRSPRSLVPARARVVYTRLDSAQGSLLQRFRITRRARVAAAVRFLNRLGRVQPYTVNCPALAVDPNVLTVRFLAGPHGRALATASFAESAGGVSSQCNPVTLTVGRRRATLIGGRYVATLDRLLGVKAG